MKITYPITIESEQELEELIQLLNPEAVPAEPVEALDDEPTRVEYYDAAKTKLRCEVWKDADGMYHRDGDKPAFIWYDQNGQIQSEKYYKYDKQHRAGDKPASISYNENEQIQSEYYCKYGKGHRDGDKPAYIWYDQNRQIEREYYYKDGVKYTPTK
jgi:hypothetical protein